MALLAVCSAYFQGAVVGGAEGSRLWGLAVGVAMLVVAITSPDLGVVSDFAGSKKRFLFFYTAMSVLFTAGLFFAAPGQVLIGTLFFILAEIGYRSGPSPSRCPPERTTPAWLSNSCGGLSAQPGATGQFGKCMLAFLVYNDGVIVALNFAAIIGAVIFGLDQQQLIIFVILVQVTNGIGAYVFGRLVDDIGGKRSLVIAIVLMLVVIAWLYLNETATGFFIIGALDGLGMAGAQSVSRTMVAMFSPPGQSAEFYGFFAVAGRTSSFIGPTVYGIVAAEAAFWFQSQGQSVALVEQSGQRVAILTIGLFFIAGLVLLSFVRDPGKGEPAA